MTRPRLRTAVHILVFSVLGAHFLFVCGRLPRGWQKRAQAIEKYRTEGRFQFHLGRNYKSEARDAEWLALNTPKDCAILYRGPQKGAIEFMPALLLPRLIVAEPSNSTLLTTLPEKIAGRVVARGTPPGMDYGVLVLIADGHGFKLETH